MGIRAVMPQTTLNLSCEDQSLASITRCVRSNFSGLKRQLPYGVHVVLAHDADKGCLTMVVHSSKAVSLDAQISIPIDGSSIIPRILSSSGAIAFEISSHVSEEESSFAELFSISTILAVRVQISGNVFGVIIIGRADVDPPFSNVEIASVDQAAQQLAYRLSEYMKNEQLDLESSAPLPSSNNVVNVEHEMQRQERFRLLSEMAACPIVVLY